MPEYISAEILRWAVVLADDQSFSTAAQKLQIDPSVLRAQIHELSTRVGCQIFQEMEDRVELTEAGKVLIQAARGYLAWLEKQIK
jgi:DNA-binding transcriptional LysR family regulator